MQYVPPHSVHHSYHLNNQNEKLLSINLVLADTIFANNNLTNKKAGKKSSSAPIDFYFLYYTPFFF